jgi:uncharacterized membrane protein YeiH
MERFSLYGNTTFIYYVMLTFFSRVVEGSFCMLINLLSLFGVAVAAVSGTLTAGRKNMDIFGVFVIAAVSAIGGGTLRDVIINRHPIFWFSDPINIYVILGTVLLTMLYTRFFRPPNKTLLIADALGLAVFTVTGAQIAVQMRLPVLIVIFVAILTAVAGGVVRDVLCSQIPLVFRSDLYVTTVIGGACIYVFLLHLGIAEGVASVPAMLTVFCLRLAAIFFHWHLPRYTLLETSSTSGK